MEELFLDEIDRRIVQIIQKDPNLTHSKIAMKVKRSQPTVGMRIKRLEESGLLKYQAGINVKDSGMHFAQVGIQTNNPNRILEIANSCPFMLNAFRLSGTSNISVLLTSFSLKDLDNVVNFHFRSNPDIIKVNMEIITEILKDFVLPMEFGFHCGCHVEDQG